MPMSRYEIRNEYSLADPELYRTADKDDPEALLEGVAMAGLVGVLRQLGDLAEFAAEIFHNLHEEVMATAARGHGLMIRVQQLETEVPSIEGAFLSQTDHSSFFYQAGLDWHPNLQVDQNLITQGDLPRFIMDSYEECRAPPRLFLLDKFDVGGAGACLKRYTDPSFFKVETSVVVGPDVQREKKIRKGKKKGPRWRNGETTDVLPTSHAKLHQLFLEERVENGVSTPSHRPKLKRKLNGFPFNSKTGKSYMEKILNSTSPDPKVLYEVDANSSPLMLATNGSNKSGSEVRSMSADRGSVGEKRSPPLSPDREEVMLNHTMCQQREIPIDDNISKAPNSCPRFATDGMSSTLTEVDGEKVISVDAESCREGSLTGYQSDGISSEVENYVDAPSTIESEMDTDKELKVKSSFTSSHVKDQPLISKANEEDHQTRSSDAQSTGDSTISDDGNNSSRKEVSSFCSSDSPSTSAVNQESDTFSGKCSPSADNPEVEIIGGLSNPKTDDEDFPVDQHPKPVVSDAITNCRSDCEQLTSSLCSNETKSVSQRSDSGVKDEDIMNKYEADEIASTLEDGEKKTSWVTLPPGSSVVSDVESQSGDDSPRSGAGEGVNGPNGDIQCQARDSSVTMSLDLLHEDGSDREVSNPAENIASTLIMSNVPSQSTNSSPEMISSENIVPSELDDECPKLPENLDHEDSDVSIGNPDNFPYNVEDSLGMKPVDTSSAQVQIVDAEDNHSDSSLEHQIISETVISSYQADSPDEDGILPLETYHSCEVEGLQGGVITDSEALEISCSAVEGLKEPAGTSDTEISADLKPMNDVLVLPAVSESEADKSNSIDMASSLPAVSDSDTMDSVCSPVEYHGNLLQKQTHCSKDSSLDELENDDNHLSEGQQELSQVDEVGQTKATASGFENGYHPEAEVSDSLPNFHHDLEVEFVQAASSSGREDKIFQESGSGYHVSDGPPSWHVDYDSEQSLVQEKVSMPPNQIDDYGEIRTESSSSLPFSLQEMPDHDGDNDSTSTFSFIHCESPHSNDPLCSIFPPINPFSEINQINLGELAPLPPLPPVQWRMGKLQHSEAEMANLKEIFPRFTSPTTPSNDGVHSSPPSNDDVHASPPSLDDAHSSPPSSDDVHAPPPSNDDDHASPPSNDDVHASPPSIDEVHSSPPANDVKTLLQETKTLPTQIPLEPSSKEEKGDNGCSGLEANFVQETIEPPAERETTPASDNEITAISEEDGTANGRQVAKLPHPRNPLVENVAALDKSKLRKVTERVRPQLQKVDERDSLLEQIRTKSFNLRPTMASRPSIRGPNTNLQVAAILEKANAIRQAFVGSDEDDDDSWSDS